jgi:peptidoglycan/LPS O-acetylase OafA/YrhL
MSQSLQPRAIVIGLLVDLGGSILLSVGYVIVKALTGTTGDDTFQQTSTTTDYLIASLFGLLLVSMGGHVAARVARVRPATHGMCVGLATLAISIILAGLAPDPLAPMWFRIVSTVGVVPVAALGGYVAGKQKLANPPLQPAAEKRGG